ncbi:MAG: hypothetical protein K0R88_179 [Solirubrobacterales bacterium]|nr:hypothetical protein [Solirubrobacterales bacterium]
MARRPGPSDIATALLAPDRAVIGIVSRSSESLPVDATSTRPRALTNSFLDSLAGIHRLNAPWGREAQILVRPAHSRSQADCARVSPFRVLDAAGRLVGSLKDSRAFGPSVPRSLATAQPYRGHCPLPFGRVPVAVVPLVEDRSLGKAGAPVVRQSATDSGGCKRSTAVELRLEAKRRFLKLRATMWIIVFTVVNGFEGFLRVEKAPRPDDLPGAHPGEPGDRRLDFKSASSSAGIETADHQDVVAQVAELFGFESELRPDCIGFGHPIADAFVAAVGVALGSPDNRGLKLDRGIDVWEGRLGFATRAECIEDASTDFDVLDRHRLLRSIPAGPRADSRRCSRWLPRPRHDEMVAAHPRGATASP